MEITQEILQELKAFNRNVSYLRLRDKEAKKQSWASVSEVKKLTGWNKEQMRRARDRGYVIYKKENGQFKYDLSSIHDVHYIKTVSKLN